MQASTTSAVNTASQPPHRYVAAVPKAAVAALYSDSRSNETTSAVGIKKAPRAGREKAARRRLLSKSIMRLALDNRLQAPGADEPPVSLSALDGPCVDFNSPPIRRGIYETELCLRIVHPLYEQTAVGHALRIVGDEHDVARLHFVRRDHQDIVSPQIVLGGVFHHFTTYP